MKKVKFIFWNVLFFTALCLATFGGVEGAENVVVFVVWASLLLCSLLLNDKVFEGLKETYEQPYPTWVMTAPLFPVLFLMVWFGLIWTTVAYFLSVAFKSRVYSQTEKE